MIAKWIIVEWDQENLTYKLLGWSHLENDIVERLPFLRKDHPDCIVFISYVGVAEDLTQKALYDVFSNLFKEI